MVPVPPKFLFYGIMPESANRTSDTGRNTDRRPDGSTGYRLLHERVVGTGDGNNGMV